MLSEALGERLELTLIDRNDSFVFGGWKLDVMFGRKLPEAVRLPLRSSTRYREMIEIPYHPRQ